jgi:hypothetical protein
MSGLLPSAEVLPVPALPSPPIHRSLYGQPNIVLHKMARKELHKVCEYNELGEAKPAHPPSLRRATEDISHANKEKSRL